MDSTKGPVAKQTAAEKAIARAKASFLVFLWMVWKAINLPPPTPIQEDMASVLQNPPMAYDGMPSRRYIIQGFRGVAKSFITCAYVVWRLWNDPQMKIMIVSASKERADANSGFIKNIIDIMPFLSHLKARKGQVDTVIKFDVGPKLPDHSPSVKSVGITGQLTGSRADLIVGDDVETPGNSSTQAARDKLAELVKEFDAILKPGGTVLYLGTPQCEMSLYNELLDRGYMTIIWPARYPKNAKQRAFYGSKLAPLLAANYDADPDYWAWKPTDPKRFDEKDLEERMQSYKQQGFALQFMLDTSLSDADKFPLRLRDLVVSNLDFQRAPMDYGWMTGPDNKLELPCMGLRGDAFYAAHSVSKEMANYTGKVMAIDPSGRGKDETAYAIVYYLNGFMFVMRVGGFKAGYEDSTLEGLAKLAGQYKVSDVIIESNFGDGMFTKLIAPWLAKHARCNIEEVKSKHQKEVRIADTLEPVMSSHKLVVSQDAILHDYESAKDADGMHDPKRACFYQMSRLTRERGALAHDDRLDVLAMAVAFFAERMDIDAQKGIDQATEEFLMAHLEDPIMTGMELSKRLTSGDIQIIMNLDEDEWDYAGVSFCAS